MIEVEVVYCPPGAVADCSRLLVPPGSTAEAALQASGVLERQGLSLHGLLLGIWGRRVAPDVALREGDRVEVYRPLQCDPKEARRRRHQAQQGRSAPSGRGTAARHKP